MKAIQRFQLQYWYLAVYILTVGVHAQNLLIDQSNTYITHGYFSLLSLPIGQEFVPTFGSLNFVELQTYGANGPVTATFQVAIHQESIGGPVVGVSGQSGRPDGSEGLSHFDFSNQVPLVPGQTYVLQLLLISGAPAWWAVGYGQGDQYPSGRMILSGAPTSQYDLWFREGLVVPEPSVTALCFMGTAIIGLVKRRRVG